VVKEKRSGVPAKRYLLVLVFFALIGLLSYIGYTANEKYQREKYNKESHISEINTIEFHLDQLSNSRVILIKPAKDYASRDSYYYLKVEEIMEDDVLFSIFQVDKYSPTCLEIEKAYLNNKNNHNTVVIPKKHLYRCFTRDYEKYKNRERNGEDLLHNGTKHEIKEIFKIFAPVIKLGSYSGYGRGSFHISIKNEGRGGMLTSIENLEGNLEWTNTLPQRIEPSKNYSGSSITLNAENFEYGKKYKFIITVKDSLGNMQQFMVKGINGEKTFEQLYDIE
jgi:hypothetical protein